MLKQYFCVPIVNIKQGVVSKLTLQISGNCSLKGQR